MSREDKYRAIDALCLKTVCYSCNFTCVCNRVKSLAELSDETLDAMIDNGNRPGAGLVHIDNQYREGGLG